MDKYIRFTFGDGIKHTMKYLFYLENKEKLNKKYKNCKVNVFYELNNENKWID